MLRHDVGRFTQNDFKELESRLKDFIPFIRFFSITKDQYTLGVLSYENILPDTLRNELRKFFESNGEKSPPKDFLPSRIPINQMVPDSVLINNRQLELLASSRDGMNVNDFHRLCINKGPTLVVIHNCKGNILDNIILSRIGYGKLSVFNGSSSLLGFQDLNWFEGRYKKRYFEKEILKFSGFVTENYEVFQVVKK
ncbi:15995_t:CDS:2 [Funneliformis caledonium]|uniref:15995_t:CDS:1 n=1 Tax=Funneliformis caledonium TaxID=1117310 RepID=A0A9N9EG44_9GLOM|nr:15995_t:CDS:2 [Funneliformis caledonium]